MAVKEMTPPSQYAVKMRNALDKPLPQVREDIGDDEFFDPWEDIIHGIWGSYAAKSDALAISTLEAVRDKRTFDFIKDEGFSAEFMLYVLAGHGYLNYGTSPRGGWPDESVADMWQELIDKWKAYYEIHWGEPYDSA